MKTMLLIDLAILAKSLRKNVVLWALLTVGTCLAMGSAPAIILLVGFPMSHMVLAPMLVRDQRADWTAFRQALPLARADVVRGRYASITIVVAGCVTLGFAGYAASWILNTVVPGLPLIKHFSAAFDAPTAVSFAVGTFALTISMFSLWLPFMLAGSRRKAVAYIPFAFALLMTAWVYLLRDIDLDVFLPFVGQVVAAAQTLGGALAVGACVTALALAFYALSLWAALRGYRTRDL